MQPSLLRTLLLATTVAATPTFLWASDALEGSQDETTVPNTLVPSIADLCLEPSASIAAPVLDALDTDKKTDIQDATAVSEAVLPDRDDEEKNIDPAVIADNDGVEVRSDAVADTNSESGNAQDPNPAANAAATGEAIAVLEGFDATEDDDVAPIKTAGDDLAAVVTLDNQTVETAADADTTADALTQDEAAHDHQGSDSEGFSSEEGVAADNDASPDNS